MASTANASATSAATVISAEALLAHWQGHRRLTRRVIEAFPEDKLFDFSLGGMRPFSEMAMEFVKPTQILRETTTGRIVSAARDLDHQSRIAWNLFTGLYFKVDGLPWGPTGLAQATCFVGISFFRPFGSISTLRTSVVQAFDENGEGLVLRGHDFHWDDQAQGRAPHLDADSANRLVQMVLSRYTDERKQPPQRVVVHKSSRFEPAEREGFESALRTIRQYDLVALSPVSDVRLARAE